MTLNEEECSQKWTAITQKLADIEALIKDLVETHQKSAEMENIDIAKLHHSAAFAMTELEKFKLRFNLTNEELKDHSVQIENDRVEKYQKKIKKAGTPESKRPFRIDSDASKRTIKHHTA